MWLWSLMTGVALAAPPPCAAFVAPAPSAVDPVSCQVDGEDAPDLSVGLTATCSGDCAEAMVEVYVSVDNSGAEAASDVEVRLYRRRTASVSEVARQTAPLVPAGRSVVLGPFLLDESTWGDGVLEVRVDPLSTVRECDEGDNVGSVGAWDPLDRDRDHDGYRSASCGGKDCNDGDASIYPGAADAAGDGVDQNCDGEDAKEATCDLDADGVESVGCGGLDCDDANADVSPELEEIPEDGIDQDCDGVDECARGSWVSGGCDSRGGPPLVGLALLTLLVRRRS